MPDPRMVTLASIGEGALEELFQECLRKVLSNIDDPNTDPKARRQIVMTFGITSEEDRRSAKVDMACTAKLAGAKAMSVNVFIGRHEGELAAVEAPKQEEMFPQPVGRPAAVESA